ncbi:T9SS type A sorting domain-containing protein [Flavilitoribacter nigricans]|uniref:Secretion system C-terminal sorting domain-containing protein n=1 Tax=Flavilitoribacter nigricans (strain ATCC 23147 / DSM 23189 / NBRC 102662 / NCIMB 1420 / SS-2) TaxID=1122177 RepID=A0A2D0NEA5_FLAN2|nr:T9SS type A sorting domain-containing protein [Flavilitoribacter nigricans]PHN06815.1 hypothetical protein CRP01_11040 [Flavilitoribacter nigricans DSM 23189 = NBRC 102662]
MDLKQITLIAVGMLLLSPVRGQEHFIIPEGYGKWTYSLWADPGIAYGELTYTLIGDTMINAENYKQLYLNDTTYLGAMRYQSDQLQVIPRDSSVEYMVFDYRLNAGDSLEQVYRGGALTTIKVLQTDSILVGTEYRKVWRESCGEWISGVGSTWTFWGAEEETECFFQSVSLECFEIDSTVVYGNCPLPTAVKQTEPEPTISIYPNPTDDLLKVSVDAGEWDYQIINALGQPLRSGTLTLETWIDLSALHAGAYTIVFRKRERRVAVSRRFIISR